MLKIENTIDFLKDSLSPRAIALAYVARAFSVTDSRSLFLPQDKWLSKAPESLLRDFGPAQKDLRNCPNIMKEQLLQIQPDRNSITDILAQLLLMEEPSDKAKKSGAVFTPAWLARRVTRTAYQNWFRLHRNGRQPRLVADVSSGPGAFLLSCQNIFGGRGTRILGVDINPLCITYARLLAFASSAEWDLRCEDTLLSHAHDLPLFKKPQSAQFDSYDILVGNPPFVRSPLLPPTYCTAIRSAYPSTRKGNFDLSIAFVEQAINSLAEGGIASYILTNKFLSSKYGSYICDKLAKEVRVLSLEDFQDKQIFPGYTTYTCVLTFSKRLPTKRFLVMHFPNGVVDHESNSAKTTSLPIERLQHHPWDFASNETSDILSKLRDKRHPFLGDIFGNIIQGLRTGANQVFVIDSLNKSLTEPELLIPFINGEYIRRCRADSSRLLLIFPYTINDFGEAVIIPEQDLRKKYPKCWSYLLSHRSLLQDRSIDPNFPWYAYSRSQNLLLGRLRKLLVREMMPRAEFAADLSGQLVFSSGYGLDATRMNNNDLKMWTVILCTRTMEFSLRYSGTQLQSGWFRLLKHHLRRVRLPLLQKTEFYNIQQLAAIFWDNPDDEETLEKIDSLIANIFGLSRRERDFIKVFLQDCHDRSLGKSQNSTIAPSKIYPNYPDPRDVYEPIKLTQYNPLHIERADLQKAVTFVPNKDLPIHRWYKYSQGYSANVVDFLIKEFALSSSSVVLDPFTGCGTTNLVCDQYGIPSFGIEISPLMAWISRAKTFPWKADEIQKTVSSLVLPAPSKCNINAYEMSPFYEYLKKAYSTKILRQLWTFVDCFDHDRRAFRNRIFLKLGLLSIMEEVSQIRKHGSHYRYMLKADSIGLQKLNTPIIDPDADIRPILLKRLKIMLEDVRSLEYLPGGSKSTIILGDARHLPFGAGTVTHVISSPPYLNRNNYIAQQKAELAILSLILEKDQYRRLVQRTLCSHVEARFPPGKASSRFHEVEKILSSFELSPNNNPKIPYMIAGYFDDLHLVLSELYRVMRSGGKLGFILGNSRWGGVIVPVDHLFSLLAEKVGFSTEKIFVTRLKGNSPQQMRKYGRIPVRESIVIAKRN